MGLPLRGGPCADPNPCNALLPVNDMSIDKRRFMRTEVNLRVKLSHPSIGVVTTTTRDISDGGAYLLFTDKDKLPVGSVVKVQVQDSPGDAPVLHMRVVSHKGDGIGLEFIDAETSL